MKKGQVIPILISVVCFFLCSCTTSSKIKDGATAYTYKKYALAAELLQTDFEKATTKKQRSDLALQIARSYDFQNRFADAEKWYKTITEIDINPEAWWLYGQALKRVEKYDEAIKAFQQYGKYNPTARTKIDAELQACREVLEVKQKGNRIRVVPMTTLNSPGADYQPVLHNGALYFSSHNAPGEAGTDAWMGTGYGDILIATSSGPGQADIPTPWNTQINSKYHEGTPAFSPDGKTVYFTRCGSDGTSDDYCHINVSRLEGSQWSTPEIVPLFPDSINTGHPFLGSGGNELYFSSDFPNGYGGKDLFISVRTGNTWSAPVNLGPRVNTPGNEVFPSIATDGKLYFSSDGHPGFGGLDIFMSEKQGNMFMSPLRLKYPVNSGGDDLGMALLDSNPDDSVLMSGYFSSNRPGSANDDIYYFEQRMAPPVILPPPVFILAGKITEPVYEKPGNPNSRIIGTQPLPGSAVSLSWREKGAPGPTTVSLSVNEKGEYQTILDKPENKDYRTDASKSGYLSANKLFNTSGTVAKDGDTITIRQEITLTPIFKKVEVVLNNIYYNLDKSDIREDAKPTLDTLAGMLKDNPGLVIELASHTDSRGSDAYNLNLSQKRAQSVVDYLISSGIDARRLVAKGYGESKLVNKCANGVTCTEEEHQQNRRTTFSILSDTFKP